MIHDSFLIGCTVSTVVSVHGTTTKIAIGATNQRANRCRGAAFSVLRTRRASLSRRHVFDA